LSIVDLGCLRLAAVVGLVVLACMAYDEMSSSPVFLLLTHDAGRKLR
jgi:hypothetical protein